MNTTAVHQSFDFTTKTSLKWVIFSYVWRMLAVLAALSVLCVWLLIPRAKTLGIVLWIVIGVIVLFDGTKRMLHSRAGLCFHGNSLTVLNYLKTSFRLDGLTSKEFILVQSPFERAFNVGRILIKKKAIYLRGVRDFKALRAYVEGLDAGQKADADAEAVGAQV